jgi:hypothetical protein
MTEITISINDESINLEGEAAENFEKDRLEQHTEFLKLEEEKASKKLAAEAKIAALGLTADDLRALGL